MKHAAAPARGTARTRRRAGARDPESRAESRAGGFPARARARTRRPRRRGDCGAAKDRRSCSPTIPRPGAFWQITCWPSATPTARTRPMPRHVQASTRNPRLRQAAVAMVKNDIPRAEPLLKAHLHESADRRAGYPHARRGRDARWPRRRRRKPPRALPRARARLLAGALPTTPSCCIGATSRREALAGDRAPARGRIRAIPRYRNLHAVILSRVGEYERSSRMYAELLREYPAQCQGLAQLRPRAEDRGPPGRRRRRLSQTHRAAIPPSARPTGALPTSRRSDSTEADLAAMQRARSGPDSLDDATGCIFTSRSARPSRTPATTRASFEHYAKGNALHRARIPTTPSRIRSAHQAPEGAHSRANSSRERAGCGCPMRPIRSSSSACRARARPCSSRSCPATRPSRARANCPRSSPWRGICAAGRTPTTSASYAEVLAAMNAADLRELGEHYIERTRMHRKTGRPYFIDKMPNNFLHVAMIHLALPNAKIIDARRHPMACCFSNFKQHYARGQRFSYDLADMGRFYRDYVELMAHFDAVLPGANPPGLLRADRRGHRDGGAAAARLLRPAVRERLPALLRERAAGADRQLRAGPPADLPRRHGPLAPLRSLARTRSRRRSGRCCRLPGRPARP